MSFTTNFGHYNVGELLTAELWNERIVNAARDGMWVTATSAGDYTQPVTTGTVTVTPPQPGVVTYTPRYEPRYSEWSEEAIQQDDLITSENIRAAIERLQAKLEAAVFAQPDPEPAPLPSAGQRAIRLRD